MPRTLTIGSLCTGYGGLDTAVLDVLGGEVLWHADNAPDASQLLTHHWPAVPNLGDITRTDWNQVPPVDVLTAGFPCTDLSAAGKRAGIAPGTRSGVWAHVARAINALNPKLVVIENVRGICSAPSDRGVGTTDKNVEAAGPHALRALGRVLGDLADLGFDAEWHGITASSVGAAHARFRVFVLAWPAPADPDSFRSHRDRACGGRRHEPAAYRVASSDTQSIGRRRGRPEPAGFVGRPDAVVDRPEAPADTGRHIRQEDHPDRSPAARGCRDDDVDWGAFAPAIRRAEHTFSRRAPRPVDASGRLASDFTEWLMALPAGHVTAVPGLTRTAQLRLLGNGVVPAQAAHALRLLLDRAPEALAALTERTELCPAP